jgi:hypothetical protein
MKDQAIKMPPLLLGATLVFWGWQTHLLPVGILMGIGLESARWIKSRWNFSNEDFNRIWTFCTLLLLAATVYGFTSNEGPSNFGGFFQHPNLRTERGVGTTTAKTAAAVVRWLPMMFFLFVGAQNFSVRQGIPLETISLILRRRWKKARKLGLPLPATRNINISYIYFALCLVAASVHAEVDNSFFWGLTVLVAWALWPHRSRSVAAWGAAIALVVALGYFGQGGLGHLRIYLESFNPQWFSNWSKHGFDAKQSQTALGEIGRIKGSSRIVIRLQPGEHHQPPGLLREASYRKWQTSKWSAGLSKEDFENVLPEKPDDTYILVPGKTNTVAVKIACYLQRPNDLLPLPEGTSRLENMPAYTMQKNSAGAVRVSGPGLVIFDAFYGPGATLDGPPDFKEDIYVYPRETNALNEVIAQFHLSGANREQTLRNLSAFFLRNFSYSTWQERSLKIGPNDSPLSRFLLKTHKGHCEYFATATVLLLREMNIPARYAVGYAVHESSGSKYVVRQRDAHAWCLVWNEAANVWEDFDTTPGSWVAAEEARASPAQFLSDAWSRITFELSRLRWGQTHLRQYILWALVPVLAVLLYQIIWRGRRKRQITKRPRSEYVAWPGLDSEFYRLERCLSDRGVVRGAAEPLGKWLERAASDAELQEMKPPLEKLLALHYRYRFDPNGLSTSEREHLRGQTLQCLERLATSSRRT